jgi:hypothetical protein
LKWKVALEGRLPGGDQALPYEDVLEDGVKFKVEILPVNTGVIRSGTWTLPPSPPCGSFELKNFIDLRYPTLRIYVLVARLADLDWDNFCRYGELVEKWDLRSLVAWKYRRDRRRLCNAAWALRNKFALPALRHVRRSSQN